MNKAASRSKEQQDEKQRKASRGKKSPKADKEREEESGSRLKIDTDSQKLTQIAKNSISSQRQKRKNITCQSYRKRYLSRSITTAKVDKRPTRGHKKEKPPLRGFFLSKNTNISIHTCKAGDRYIIHQEKH